MQARLLTALAWNERGRGANMIGARFLSVGPTLNIGRRAAVLCIANGIEKITDTTIFVRYSHTRNRAV